MMKPKFFLEICPPLNSASIPKFYHRISHLIDSIEGISIPSKSNDLGTGGFERGYKFAQYLRQEQHLSLNILFHVTCYDLNMENIHHRLSTLETISVDQILVVTGDNYQVAQQDKSSHFCDSSQLVNYILAECNWRGSVAIAAYPGNELQQECTRLRKKIQTGSNSIYTQCIFDANRFGQFVECFRTNVSNKIRIIPSIALFKDRSSLKSCYNLMRVEENNKLDFELTSLNPRDCDAYIEEYLTELCKELLGVPQEFTINICTFNQFEMAGRLINNLVKLDL